MLRSIIYAKQVDCKKEFYATLSDLCKIKNRLMLPEWNYCQLVKKKLPCFYNNHIIDRFRIKRFKEIKK